MKCQGFRRLHIDFQSLLIEEGIARHTRDPTFVKFKAYGPMTLPTRNHDNDPFVVYGVLLKSLIWESLGMRSCEFGTSVAHGLFQTRAPFEELAIFMLTIKRIYNVRTPSVKPTSGAAGSSPEVYVKEDCCARLLKSDNPSDRDARERISDGEMLGLACWACDPLTPSKSRNPEP